MLTVASLWAPVVAVSISLPSCKFFENVIFQLSFTAERSVMLDLNCERLYYARLKYFVSYTVPMFQIYLMDIHIWYTLLSAVVGGVMGARSRLGEVLEFSQL